MWVRIMETEQCSNAASVSKTTTQIRGFIAHELAKQMIWRMVTRGNARRFHPKWWPLGRDLYLMSEAELAEAKIQRLPRSLGEAIELLQADAFLCEAIGAPLIKSYCDYKKDEWERYSVSISEWEIEEYMRLY